MADKEVVIGVKVETGDSQRTLGELEKEFERLNEEIRKVPVGSADFDKLSKEMAQVGKEVKNAELAFESLDTEQTAAELGSVAGAVGDVSAAFILLGDDSEELQEVAQNIELALGLSMGLKGAIEGLSSARKLLTNSTKAQMIVEKINTFIKGESAATSAAVAAGETARGTATAGATVATSAATGAMKLFRIALISTGIGAIIVGIGLLIANFESVSKWIRKVADDIYNIFKPQIDIVIGALQYLGIVESDEEKARRERQEEADKRLKEFTQNKIDNINKEIEAQQKLTDELSSAIDFEIEKKRAAGEDFSNLEQEKIRMLIASTKQEIDLINQKIAAKQKEIDQTKLANGISLGNDLAGYKIQKKEQEIFLEEQFKALELWGIKQDKLKKDAIKRASSEKKKANEKELADEKKHQEELLKAKLDAIAQEEKVTDDYRKRQLTDEQKEIDDLTERLYKELEMAGNNNELKLLLEEEYQQNVQAIKQKYVDEWNAKEREQLEKQKAEQEAADKAQNDLRIELMEEGLQKEKQLLEVAFFERLQKLEEEGVLTNELRAKLFKDYQDQQKALEDEARKESFKAAIDNAEGLNKGLSDLNNAVLEAQLAAAGDNEEKKQEIRKKAFKRQKALDLADATIQGIKAVQAALASPFPFNIALAAINGATAAANIAKIASVKFEGESGGGGGASSGGLGNTARAAGGANVPQVANTTTTIGDPTQVYVLEQDISNTQNKVSVNEQQATL